MADASLNPSFCFLQQKENHSKCPHLRPTGWSGRKPSCGPSQLTRSLHPKLEKWALC